MRDDRPPALAALVEAARGQGGGATGDRVAAHVGRSVPRPLLEAVGLHPRRLWPDPDAPTPVVDGLLGDLELTWAGRRLLEAVLARDPADVVLIGRDTAEMRQLHAMARELARTGVDVPGVALLDVVHLPTAASRAYVRRRVGALAEWLRARTDADPTVPSLTSAIEAARAQQRALADVERLRRAEAPPLTATEAAAVRAAAWQLPAADHRHLVTQLLAQLDGRAVPPGPRVLLTGAPPPTDALAALLDRAGAQVVAEQHVEATTWMVPWPTTIPDTVSGCLDLLADRLHADAPELPGARAAAVAAAVVDLGVDRVVHLVVDDDDPAAWDLPDLRLALADLRIPLLELRCGPARAEVEALAGTVTTFLRRGAATPVATTPCRAAADRPPTPGRRARKDLDLRTGVTAHQRRWFEDLTARARAGEPVAVVDADFPQEVLRALDVPYVVNQWWASIVGATQQTAAHLDALRRHGYPAGPGAYSTMGLAAALGPEVDEPPWGGLPTPTLIGATTAHDIAGPLTAAWAARTGATVLQVERTADARWTDLPVAWWDELPDRWDEVLEDVRLDLLVAELHRVIATLESVTGRRFDPTRFEEVMALVDEQEAAYRRTRDLIARTRPAPVGIADTMPATMVPQWHRGTTWARDAALALEEAVVARATAGEGTCDERLRLAWIGRGLWSDLGFYQRFEQSHGAVFVWSMYLGLAADGYLRSHDRGRDPLRALAARFVTMGDELRMPTWAGAWHVKEVLTHGCDGAVAIADADPFVLRALTAAGIPVLHLPIDNTDRTADGGIDLDAAVAGFCDQLLAGG